MNDKGKIRKVNDEVVIDSADVERATEIALKRGKAIVVEEESIGNVTVDEEIMQKRNPSKLR